MATYNLRRFSHVDGIKGIGEDHLSAVLEPHAEYLSGRGVKLPKKGEDSPLPYPDLVRVLMTPDATTPKGFADAFYLIHEMSTPESMDALMAGAKSRGMELEGDHLTPSDVAAQVFLKDRDLLESAHGQQYMTRLRSFEYFQCGARKVPSFQVPGDDTIASLQSSLASWFESHNRSGEVRVSVFPGDDETSFLVRHGDPLKREGCLGQDERVIYRPERFDVLVYTPSIGEIRMNACSDTEREMYRKAFGFHVFGDEDFFPGTEKYTLDPLRTNGPESCVCRDVDGMEWVKLTELKIHWGGNFQEVEARTASDIFAAYSFKGQGVPNGGRILGAKFLIKFRGARRPRMVTIRPSNVAQYTRDSDSGVVEEWLKRRGFVRVCEGVRHAA